jgi:hypothetical protein
VDGKDSCEVGGECAFELAVATCQMADRCDGSSVGLNTCIQTNCVPVALGCDQALAALVHFSMSGCCSDQDSTHGECTLVSQCGCAADEKCDLVDSEDNTGCGPVGVAPAGSKCATHADCAKGAWCRFGACHAYCSPHGAACSNGGACMPSGIDPITTSLFGCTCRISCDPVNPAQAGPREHPYGSAAVPCPTLVGQPRA